MGDLTAIADVVSISEAQVRRCHRLAVESFALKPEETDLFLAAARRLPNRAFARISSFDICRGILDILRRES